ncbi:MAG TPA: FG-GAP-like repeat-containing protein [Candidatus Polarisedimenticolaceae bacterium]
MPLLIAQGLLGLASSMLASCPVATFSPQHVVPSGGAVEGIAVADFDRDGIADLAVANFSRVGGTPSEVAILLGDGRGGFGTPSPFAAGNGATQVVASDFDGDGNADVAVLNTNDGTVSVLLGDGLGALGPQVVFPAGGTAIGLVHGDLDRDGDDDLVVPNFLASRVTVLLGSGDGSFSAPFPIPVGSQPILAAVGDLDGDGNLDIATDDVADATVSILLGRGDGTFAPRTVVPLPQGAVGQSLALSDLDDDGVPDMVVVNAADGSVLVFPGRGDGAFKEPSAFGVAGLPVFVTVGDLNGDGSPDLAVGNAQDASVSVLVNRGDGTFDPQIRLPVGTEPIPVAIGDLNGDGALDLVAGNLLDETISVLLNACTGNRPPRADAGPDQVLECGGDLRAVATLDGSASADPDSTPGTDDDIASFEWFEGAAALASGPRVTTRLSLGTHDVTLTVTDRARDASSDTSRVTVQDTLPPAAITVTSSPSVLGPPNRRLVPVTISVAANDRCDPAPVCRIDSVTSAGPARFPVPGGARADFVVVDPGPEASPAALTVLLRAERSRGPEARSYTIAVSCADAAGNVVNGETTVTVSRGRVAPSRATRSGPTTSIPSLRKHS